jgi:hypothetical protein
MPDANSIANELLSRRIDLIPSRKARNALKFINEGAPHSKRCSRCKEIKPLDQFSVHAKCRLGHNARCKGCIRRSGIEYTRRLREGAAGRMRPDRCDSCGEPNCARRSLHYDHNHVTGLFRGWLCHRCNTALGQMDDSVAKLQSLIKYLQRGGGPGRKRRLPFTTIP